MYNNMIFNFYHLIGKAEVASGCDSQLIFLWFQYLCSLYYAMLLPEKWSVWGGIAVN